MTTKPINDCNQSALADVRTTVDIVALPAITAPNANVIDAEKDCKNNHNVYVISADPTDPGSLPYGQH